MIDAAGHCYYRWCWALLRLALLGVTISMLPCILNDKCCHAGIIMIDTAGRSYYRCRRAREIVSLDAGIAEIDFFCLLMPAASASVWPCTASQACCFQMSTPSERSELQPLELSSC